MPLRATESLSPSGILFLRHCYAFVNVSWQHAVREPIPDQGFEMRFRESCNLTLDGWVVSQEREMHLGCGLDTASGVSHEVDIVTQNGPVMAILELKNRAGWPPEKNDVIVFFAKIIDYLALSPTLAQRELIPVFVSTFAFEYTGLAACVGLGIHPIAPQLRPLPLLQYNARCMQQELDDGLLISSDLREAFYDYCSTLNRLSVCFDATALNRRCDYLNETAIVMNAIGGLPTAALGDDLRLANTECTTLINAFQAAKRAGSTS